MDISDGLVQDLGHICRASGVGAIVHSARVPLSPAVRAAVSQDHSLLASVLTGGDDYELLFTAPASATDDILALGRAVGEAVTAIGDIVEGKGVSVVDEGGHPMTLGKGGWRHFGATDTGAGA
jgi:thiamine-monophosphate kinase